VIPISCIPDNRITRVYDNQQCQKEVVVNESSHKDHSFSCIKLPYFNSKKESIELLTYILYAENNTKLISGQSGLMQIVYQPSTWQVENRFQIKYDDKAQLLKICSENSSAWFSSHKHFLLALEQKYLNVAKKG